MHIGNVHVGVINKILTQFGDIDIHRTGRGAVLLLPNGLEGMAALRKLCDEAEIVTAADCWPFPTYGDLLFGV